VSRTVTFIDAITEAMREEMERDETVFLIGEDIGIYGGVFKATKGLQKQFGEYRVIDSPLSENVIVGSSIGAALQGMRPVPEIQFSDFITPAMDQIVQQAAKLRYRSGGDYKIPMTIRVCCGGEVGGGLYHSQINEAWFVHTPGLVVVAPSTPYDAKGLLKASIRDDNPVIFFEHKKLYRSIKGEIPDEDYIIPLGSADIKRPGKHVTIITYMLMLHKSLKAAEELAKEGIECEVIDLRTIYPIDKQTILESVKKTSRVVIVVEAPKTGSVAGELSAIINEEAFDYLDAPILRVCGPDTPPIPFSPPMEHYWLPSPERIIKAVKHVVNY
jgi:2-oxoisovalerate dehydrogenase E1 component beta subunit